MIPPRTDGRYVKARLAAAPFRILGTGPEPAFDIFTELVCTALDVRSALLGFFDGETLCIKALAGTLQHEAVIAAGLRDAFENEHPIVQADPALFLCAAPVYTPAGHAIGVIAGFDDRARGVVPSMTATLDTIALAVTHALDARKRAVAETALTRALIAFDARDFAVLFADAETVRGRNATPANVQSLSFNDLFSGIDDTVRHELDVMRDTLDHEPIAFTARTLGARGFWYPVACTARAVRSRSRSIIVVEYAQANSAEDTANSRAPARLSERRTRWEGHSIQAVLSKIEAGRRALRAERGELDEPLTGDAFVSAAAQLLAGNAEPHVLAVFAPGREAIGNAIERARRARLLCDHDLVAVLDNTYVAMVLRDMPVTIGHQAVKRFARSHPNVRFEVRATSGPGENIRDLLEDAIAGLRTTN